MGIRNIQADNTYSDSFHSLKVYTSYIKATSFVLKCKYTQPLTLVALDYLKADHSDEVETLVSDYLYLKCDDGVYRRPGSLPVYIPETSDG